MTSRVLWVQLEHGDAGMQRLIAQSSLDLRIGLENGFHKARWYPYELFIELNIVIDRLFGQGDLGLVRTLGRFGADANLTTIYRLFYKLGSVQWILGRAVRLWSAHYDSGYLEVATRGPKQAILRMRGFASPHPAHCLSVAGWAERSIELSGGKQTKLEETKCRNKGEELCQLDCSWD
jgi:hypothetical protein